MREWLKSARLERNLTAKDVAVRMDMSESGYSRIETGERQNPMDLHVAAKLASALNIELSTIIAEETKA